VPPSLAPSYFRTAPTRPPLPGSYDEIPDIEFGGEYTAEDLGAGAAPSTGNGYEGAVVGLTGLLYSTSSACYSLEMSIIIKRYTIILLRFDVF